MQRCSASRRRCRLNPCRRDGPRASEDGAAPICAYGRSQRREIAVDGVALDFIDVTPSIAAYRRMVQHLEFDMCELAPTTYYIARAYGAPFKALIVTRRFHHHGLVVRGSVAIKAPKDLEGRKVGVRACSVTTGLDARDSDQRLRARCVQGDMGRRRRGTRHAIEIAAQRRSCPRRKISCRDDGRGEINAAFTGNASIGREGPPQAGWEAKQRPSTAGYTELLDARHLEAEWYGRTGIYPFHGLMVVKDDILNAHPGIAKALYGAFVEAKGAGCLHCDQAPQADDAVYRDLIPLVGDDPLRAMESSPIATVSKP